MWLGQLVSMAKVIHLLKSVSVVSLVGVVLIARPTAMFGSGSHSVPVVVVTDSSQLTTPTNSEEKGTQAERLVAIGYVITSISNFKSCKNTFKDCLDWSFGWFRSLYLSCTVTTEIINQAVFW